MAWPEAGKTWVVALVPRALASENDADAQAGIDLAGSLRLKEFSGALSKLLAADNAAEPRRTAALGARDHRPDRRNADVRGRAQRLERDDPLAFPRGGDLGRLNQEPARVALVKALATAPGRFKS